MNHEKYIRRCIQLAENGIGITRPNPSVGAVVVYEDKIIGEGYTSAYGGPHAEVNAIRSVKDKKLLTRATMYVTLEPCSHYGKTPPCADLIIKHRIPKVVIGCIDTSSEVAGRGIKRLQASGCEVIVGVLEAACLEQHKRFFTYHNENRPYIILKWAETKDGFIAPLTKIRQAPVWISNTYSQQLVHKWRSQEHAILVGTNTVALDNPKLNVRKWGGNDPVRIVLDRNLRLSSGMAVLDGSIKTIVFTEKPSTKNNTIIYETIDFSKNIAQQISQVLHQYRIQSVIIEGGTKTLETFIKEGLWDEARVFIGNNEFKEGVNAPNINGILSSEETIGNDILRTYIND